MRIEFGSAAFVDLGSAPTLPAGLTPVWEALAPIRAARAMP